MFLHAEHVSFGYGSVSAGSRPLSPRAHGRPRALDSVGLAIERGSLTGLLGPNGCGKTTLLKLVAGVLRPDSGTITLDGRALASFTRRELARRVAVVPQETHPAFDYSVLEMVLMGRHPHLRPFQLEGPDDLSAACDAMTATGTLEFASRPYMSLSGGEKQRVMIASALAQAPEILLLDEPTASLDLGYQLEVCSLLSALNRDRGVTIIIATHDLNIAASLCHRLVLLREGRVVGEGPTEQILTTEAIRALYDVDVDVRHHDRTGHLTIVPIGRVR